MSSSMPTQTGKPPPETDQGAQYLPPFPPHGTGPTHKPHRQDLFNAAAVHVAPEKPAPGHKEEGAMEEQQESTRQEAKRHAGHAEPQQEPIAKGTPLDELVTPGFGAMSHTLSQTGAALPRATPASQPVATQPSVTPQKADHSIAPPLELGPVPEGAAQQTSDNTGSSQNGRSPPVRPSFGATKDMGSVSPFSVILLRGHPFHLHTSLLAPLLSGPIVAARPRRSRFGHRPSARET